MTQLAQAISKNQAYHAARKIITRAMRDALASNADDFGAMCAAHKTLVRALKHLSHDGIIGASAGPVDVGTITEYGLSQKLSNAVRCY